MSDLSRLQTIEREALTRRDASSILALVSALRRYRDAARELSLGKFSGCDCAHAVGDFLDCVEEIETNPEDSAEYIPPWSDRR